MPNQPNTRAVLIGLNALRVLRRGVLCRLAGDVERWYQARGKGIATEAMRLGVPAAQLRRALSALHRAVETGEGELERAQATGCAIVVRGDREYPDRLLDLPMPPPLLFVRGTIPPGPAVAIVGARKMDGYGAEATRYFADGLAMAGLPVISGFAMGVDRVAHRATLDAKAKGGAGTVAVLGCGIDIDYPARSGELATEIANHGAVVSEFPLGTEPRPWHFPVRNRIIAALSVGTLVVQAKARSGALNTARHALEINRDVYAVPGRIFEELALGPNALIGDGALTARSVEDILGSLPLAQQSTLFEPHEQPTPTPKPVNTRPTPRVAGLAGNVLNAIPPVDGAAAEDLAATVGQTIDQVLGALLELELMGHVRRLPGPRYLPAKM